MRIVIALGGNALLQRGESLTMANQIANICRAAAQIAPLAAQHELLITHGNGPQIGLLALQAAASELNKGGPGPAAPNQAPPALDVLGAESAGMIGYLLEQELSNVLPRSRTVATLLTRVVVDMDDPAFKQPSKPIGPLYSQPEAEQLAARHGWSIHADGAHYRRVVASPKPQRIVDVQPILWLLERNAIVIAAGGGGIPVCCRAGHNIYSGVEAVIDKDLTSALLAQTTAAELLIIATDVDAVYKDWQSPRAQPLYRASIAELRAQAFAAGSMGPKIAAACQFVEQTGHPAVIGSLDQIGAMVTGHAGTRVVRQAES